MKEFFYDDDLQPIWGLTNVEIANLSNGGVLPRGKIRGGRRIWTFGELMSCFLNHNGFRKE